jgi:diguanylate cyclase (GGDEF)-like protein
MPRRALEERYALLREILTAKTPPELPRDLAAEEELARLYAELLELRRFIMAIAGGDLSTSTDIRGYTAGALKTLQANLKHMTWQTQMIATGDFSQRLDFMGDFSKAFNSMASQLEESQRIIRESQEELARTNAGLELEVRRRERAQAALAEREAHYRNLTETMKDVVWILDTETLHFTYVSPSVERLRGFTPKEIMAQPLDAALAPRETWTLTQMIRANRQKFLDGSIDETMYFTSEVEQIRKDGSTVWTEAIVRYVQNDKTGGIDIHGVTRDISDRRALMIDIDHFKNVNDTFGHATGDLAIRAVATACGSELRNSDLIGRIGGEEFCILLVETELEKACGVAERLRGLVQDIRLTADDGRTVGLTASIGVAGLRHGEHDLPDLMARADKALYQAKNAGRNRVECHENSDPDSARGGCTGTP